MITANIVLTDSTKIVRYFDNWPDLCAWVERHHKHLAEIRAVKGRAGEGKDG